MIDLRLEAAVAVAFCAACLGVLTGPVGIGAAGWATGLITAVVIAAAITLARLREGDSRRHPADLVTLARAMLVADVTAIVVDSWDRTLPTTATVTLASIALSLDFVDGQVARRTATASRIGAVFDQEIDAFLILVMSVAASRSFGSWVLVIGAARYLMLIAGLLVPWLAVPVPPRYWGKVVAAVQGVTLTVAISGVLPRRVALLAIAVALALLVESFAHNIVWLVRRPEARDRARLLASRLGTVASFAVVWTVLVAPDRLERMTPAWFVRLPIEGLVLVGLGLLLPRRPRVAVAWVAGTMLGLLAVVKVLDVAFYEELDRPFNPVLDWGNFGPALGVVQDSIGRLRSDLLVAGVLLALVVMVALVAASVARVSSVTAQRRGVSARGLAALLTVWAVLAATGLHFARGADFASRTTAHLAAAQVGDAARSARDRARFERRLHATDAEAEVPTTRLLTKLRGKDVVFAFVESYGQVAVQDTAFSPAVDAALLSDTAALSKAGWTSRSAFINSSTYGGISWLAHSTFQSGLWVDNEQKYDELVKSNRFTLSDAFKRAGWHTVGDVPSDIGFWTQGATFYHYDDLYDRTDVGYRGPRFAYASMPDQYTLAQFQRNELRPGHSPVMAEIDLVSSHYPWTAVPTMVPWNEVGDGSIYNAQLARSEAAGGGSRGASTAGARYGRSIQYSMAALTSWIVQLNDPNLVVVLLGDHQPSTSVSGPGANHVAVMSIVTRDPAVVADISPWNWSAGLLPPRSATTWPMDAFRNHFLDTFDS